MKYLTKYKIFESNNIERDDITDIFTDIIDMGYSVNTSITTTLVIDKNKHSMDSIIGIIEIPIIIIYIRGNVGELVNNPDFYDIYDEASLRMSCFGWYVSDMTLSTPHQKLDNDDNFKEYYFCRFDSGESGIKIILHKIEDSKYVS